MAPNTDRHNFAPNNSNTEAKQRFANTCKNTTLSSEIRKIRNKPRKLGYESESNLPPSLFESHALTTQPRLLHLPKNSPPLTQLHMLKNCQFDAAKKQNFALGSIKPNYVLIMHFKTIARYFEMKNFRNRVFLSLYCCLNKYFFSVDLMN